MLHVCEDCGYPFEGSCGNPVCVRVNAEAHAKHLAISEQRQAEQKERDQLRAWAEKSGYSAL